MDANFFASLLQWIADFVSTMISLLKELASELGIGDTTAAEVETTGVENTTIA